MPVSLVKGLLQIFLKFLQKLLKEFRKNDTVTAQIYGRKALIMANMGERIRNLRRDHGMTQGELGEKLGVGRSAILKYENGEVTNIPAEKIRIMANLFGVTPSFIMGFDGINDDAVAAEVQLIERVESMWGKDTLRLITLFLSMNDDGRSAALRTLEDLSCVPRYESVQGGSR